MRIAISNVGGTYEFDRSQGNHLLDSAYDIKQIGATGIKIFMSEDYNETAENSGHYPLYTSWSDETSTTLSELADVSEYDGIISDTDFADVFINAWPFTGTGTSDAWRAGDNNYKTYLDNEYTELKAFAAKLMTDHAGSGRRFWLSTWEGDWSLFPEMVTEDDTTLRDLPNTKRASYMLGWLNTRIRAIEDAKRENAHSGVTVHSVVECNRVYDAYADSSIDRMVTRVLPYITPDYVSYSSYEALTAYGSSYSEWASVASDRLPKVFDLISNACPNSGIIMGEFGWPENEVSYDEGDMLAHTLDIANDYGDIDAMVMWGVWDNEGTPPSNRGFACVNPDGSLTNQGSRLKSYLGGSFVEP